jgi:hypothetical protein
VNKNCQLFYDLKEPNLEVSIAWRSELFKSFFASPELGEEPLAAARAVLDGLLTSNAAELETLLSQAMTALSRHELQEDKDFYRSALILFFRTLGFASASETPSSPRRSAVEITLENRVRAIFELKHLAKDDRLEADPALMEERLDALAQNALKEIENNGYDEREQGSGLVVVKAGLVVYNRTTVKVAFAPVGNPASEGA